MALSVDTQRSCRTSRRLRGATCSIERRDSAAGSSPRVDCSRSRSTPSGGWSVPATSLAEISRPTNGSATSPATKMSSPPAPEHPVPIPDLSARSICPGPLRVPLRPTRSTNSQGRDGTGREKRSPAVAPGQQRDMADRSNRRRAASTSEETESTAPVATNAKAVTAPTASKVNEPIRASPAAMPCDGLPTPRPRSADRPMMLDRPGVEDCPRTRAGCQQSSA